MAPSEKKEVSHLLLQKKSAGASRGRVREGKRKGKFFAIRTKEHPDNGLFIMGEKGREKSFMAGGRKNNAARRFNQREKAAR